MEEQRARQRQEAEAQGENMQVEEIAPPSGVVAEHKQPEGMDPAAMTEEEQLQWALRMSMMPEQPAQGILLDDHFN